MLRLRRRHERSSKCHQGIQLGLSSYELSCEGRFPLARKGPQRLQCQHSIAFATWTNRAEGPRRSVVQDGLQACRVQHDNMLQLSELYKNWCSKVHTLAELVAGILKDLGGVQPH